MNLSHTALRLFHRCTGPRPWPEASVRWEPVVCGQCGKAMPSTFWKERHSPRCSVSSMHRWGPPSVPPIHRIHQLWIVSSSRSACWEMFCPDEGSHQNLDAGNAVGAAALWLGLHLWSCGSRCLLSFRGIRDHQHLIVTLPFIINFLRKKSSVIFEGKMYFWQQLKTAACLTFVL